MFPWAAMISLAGTAASGIMSAINNKKAQQEADAEYARQQAYNQAKANENPLSRSENQQVLNQYDRDSQRQIETARNVAAITGATPEYSLAVQKGVAEGRANLMGNIAAGASERKDKYEAAAESARQAKATADQERRAARNETFANLASNAANAFGSIVNAYSGDAIKDADYWNGKMEDLQKAYDSGGITEDKYNEYKGKYEQGLAAYYGKKYK